MQSSLTEHVYLLKDKWKGLITKKLINKVTDYDYLKKNECPLWY